MASDPKDPSATSLHRPAFVYGALAFICGMTLWTLCAGPDPASWVVGLPASGLFTWTAMRNRSASHPLRFQALPRFMGYFVIQSFRAGLDVTQRALNPHREIHPGYCAYPARLPEGTPQAVFSNLISLLPGTLCWSLADNVHQVHLLSGHALILEDLARLESRVGRLFGIDLPEELF